MIKIKDKIKSKKELLSSKSSKSKPEKEITESEAERICNMFITQIFENALSSDHPTIVYKYPVDARSKMTTLLNLIEDYISDYFFGNFYALPVVKIQEDNTVEIYSLTTNNFINILDTKLVQELSDVLESSRIALKNFREVEFRYMEDQKHQMQAYIVSRKVMLITQLRNLGYKVKSDSEDYVLRISV